MRQTRARSRGAITRMSFVKVHAPLIANKMKSAMQEDSEASTEAIDQPLLLKGNNNDQSRKNKRTSKYKNFDDPDRI